MKYRILFIVIAFIALIPATDAHAYLTTGQTVQQINETTSIYAITYEFGHGSHDFYLPIQTVRNQVHGTESNTLGFEVLIDGKVRTDVGETIALAVSDAEIVGDMYKIPKGEKKKFVLFVILTTSADELEADYAIKVTDLPFYRNDDREYLALTPSELNYYITPEVEFNTSNINKK